MHIDKIDRKILALLQADASLSAAEIAEKVGLSQSPCWRRINRLEETGIIKKRVALLDRKQLGLNVMIFAHVKLAGQNREHLAEFEDAIRRFPEVLECHTMMGEIDFTLRVVARDVEAYEKFFREQLSRLPAVQEVNSSIALSQIKSTTELPLSLAGERTN